jgi:hypothetical protein
MDLGIPARHGAPATALPGIEGGQNSEHLEVNTQHKDASMAVHAAFNAARRRLKELTESSFTQT